MDLPQGNVSSETYLASKVHLPVSQLNKAIKYATLIAQ